MMIGAMLQGGRCGADRLFIPDSGAACTLFVCIWIGNGFRHALAYKPDELGDAVGPGIRYNTLVGPLWTDVGNPAARRKDFGRVAGSIGQAF